MVLKVHYCCVSVLILFYLLVSVCGLCTTPYCRYEWAAHQIPNPRTDSGECGRFCVDTWICDPCYILDNKTATEIDAEIGPVESYGDICGSINNYIISLAIVNRVEPKQEDIVKSTERFGEDVRILQWRFGTTRCRNDVVILLSQSNKQVYTSVGREASKVLTAKCVQYITEDTKDTFSKGNIDDGLKYMIRKYKKALKEGKCDEPLQSIIIVLVIAGCSVIVIPTVILCLRGCIHARGKETHFCSDCIPERGLYTSTDDKDVSTVEQGDDDDDEENDEWIVLKLPYKKWMRLK